ncbi:MAG: hypothetical protein IBJ11_03120 [Phycisphaerales bacterium]|nr:hypothetical protein [Phycisphaerales bacterium]
MSKVLAWVYGLSFFGFVSLLGFVGYRFVRADLQAAVFRDRLEALAKDYESLRGVYNEAVRKTAVTELLVKDGKLSVIVRVPPRFAPAPSPGPRPAAAAVPGVLSTVPTLFDPSREIYVDYVVVDGRLLIRRVFDGETPPSKGLLLDEHLAKIDWDAPGLTHGKAVYRSLGEGRWVVTVTGNGSVGIARAEDSGMLNDAGELPLVAAPPVRSFDEVMGAARAEVQSIGFGDVLRHLAGGK